MCKAAMLLAGWCALAIASAGPSRARATTVTYPEGMVCGTNPDRPDRSSRLSEERFFPKAGGAIAYYRFGRGSPIVLVTGYRSTLAEWNAYFLGELAARHEVIVFDNRGVGRSVAANGDYRVQDLGSDTIALVEGLKLRDVTLLGWSMGGMIAQEAIEASPSTARRLVLIDTMPPGPPGLAVSPGALQALSGHEPDSFARIMALLFPQSVVARAEQCFMKDMFAPAGYVPPRISDSIAQQQVALMRQWHLDKGAATELHTLGIPTLVLGGTDDRILPIANDIALERMLAHAALDEVTGGGHAMMYQFPRTLARRIEAFVTNVPR
jgi:pimeloyl-ACP methyl ester carboxylesterase